MNRAKIYIKICVSCLVALFVFLNCNTVLYAEEAKPLSFNSVVEVESYELEEGYLEAGKEATIVMVLHNANTYSAANNIMLTVSSNSGMIYPLYGHDNQFFAGTLEADCTTTVRIPLSVSSRLTADYVDFNCDIAYQTSGNRITNSASMILPTQNNVTVIVSSVDVSAHATVNGKSLLSVVYTNNGTYSINDAVISVKGNVSESSKEIQLDSIAAGKSYTKDFNVVFTEPGEQAISIVLSYTGVFGERVESELGDYTVNVGEEDGLQYVESDENSFYRWIGIMISIAAFVLAAVATVVYIKKR